MHHYHLVRALEMTQQKQPLPCIGAAEASNAIWRHPERSRFSGGAKDLAWSFADVITQWQIQAALSLLH
jgi:hypothetical protein